MTVSEGHTEFRFWAPPLTDLLKHRVAYTADYGSGVYSPHRNDPSGNDPRRGCSRKGYNDSAKTPTNTESCQEVNPLSAQVQPDHDNA
jgi:hypothetical protein